MPAKKKSAPKKVAAKKSTDEQQNRLISIQGIGLAVLAGVVIFALIRLAQFRDQVDAMLMQQMAAPTVQTLPAATPVPVE